MPAKPLDLDYLRKVARTVHEHGYEEAQRILGVPYVSTVRSQFTEARRRLGAECPSPKLKNYSRPAPEPSHPPDSAEAKDVRTETRNAEYWRRRAMETEKQLRTTEHALEQIAGLRQEPIPYPRLYALPPKRGRKNRSAICGLVSDVHAGEVIAPGEILGLNEFNVEICRKRLRRYFAAMCEVGQRWASDTEAIGAYLFLTGDLISGDIHEELRITNELTSHEQVRFMVQEISLGIEHLKEAFGEVHVSSVPGNHGRTTPKPTAKLYSQLSYDTLIADMVRDRFERDDNVTFQIGISSDQIVPVLGFPIFQTHGDKIGTGGGQGFIGPIAPITRGGKLVQIQQASAGRNYYWLVMGHFHTSAQAHNAFANGSVPGYSEYANGLRASVEPPQQWIWLMHETWGVRERMEVKLEDISADRYRKAAA